MIKLVSLWLVLAAQPLMGMQLQNKQLRGQTSSRGIVMSCPAGKASFAASDWKPADLFKGFETSALVLRKLGCKLPIYNALYDDEVDIVRERCNDLQKQVGGVSCIGMPREGGQAYGYSKIFAVKAAPVNQVMFIDCDAFFVRDPTYMFDDGNFTETGALFWADIEGHFASEPQHLDATLALTPDDRKEYVDEWWFRQGYDTGLLLLDKAASRKPFEFLLHMVSAESMQKKEYDLKALSFGDKDLWHVAWLIAGPICKDNTCSLMPHASAVGEFLPEAPNIHMTSDSTFHMTSQSKLDRDGAILALHQVRHTKSDVVNPSQLISINIANNDVSDAGGGYPNDMFFGFHEGGLIDRRTFRNEFATSVLTPVSNEIQQLVKDVAACWFDNHDICAFRSL